MGAGRPAGVTGARKPTAILEMQGTLNGNRARAQGRQFEPKHHKPRVPEISDEFSPAERKRWHELEKILSPNRVVTDEDYLALRELITISCYFDALNAKVRSYGSDIVYVTSTGTRRCVPEFSTLTSMRAAYIGLLGRFGLTPADRSRVQSVPDIAEHNPEDEFSHVGREDD